MNRQEDFIDSLTDRQTLADEEDAGHWFTGVDAGVSEARDGLAVVGQEDPPLSCRPFQDHRIGGGRQTDRANAQKVNCRLPAYQSSDNAFVEILIHQERNHRFRPFALARTSNSSLVGPGRCDASILRRRASAWSSHSRRYSSISARCAR